MLTTGGEDGLRMYVASQLGGSWNCRFSIGSNGDTQLTASQRQEQLTAQQSPELVLQVLAHSDLT